MKKTWIVCSLFCAWFTHSCGVAAASGQMGTTGNMQTLNRDYYKYPDAAHLFFTPDAAAGGNGAMGNDTSTYCYLAYNLFFPTAERDQLRATAQAIMLDPNGSFGQWVVASPYTQSDPKGKPTPNNQMFLDVPSKIIFRLYAYAYLNHDRAFLHDVYPAMKRQNEFLMATVRPGEHLPHVADHNPTQSFLPVFPDTYDVIPVVGRDVYNSELYLLSLEVMLEAGRQNGESAEMLDRWQRELAAGRVEFENTFWDPAHDWYRYTEYATGSAAHVDTFFAQHVAERLNLPDLVDLSHYREQMLAHYEEFMVGRDSKGAPVGPRNMILPPGATTWPALTTLFGKAEPLQENDIWAGSAYFAAATWLRAGTRFNDRQLKAEGVAMGTAVADEIWQNSDNGFQFNDPDAWKYFNVALYTYPGYVRPLAIWEVMDAIKPITGYLPGQPTSPERTKR